MRPIKGNGGQHRDGGCLGAVPSLEPVVVDTDCVKL
jgi:hypothetical protein